MKVAEVTDTDVIFIEGSVRVTMRMMDDERGREIIRMVSIEDWGKQVAEGLPDLPDGSIAKMRIRARAILNDRRDRRIRKMMEEEKAKDQLELFPEYAK